MGLTHQKIWFGAWRTTIQASVFGRVGTGVIISGLSGNGAYKLQSSRPLSVRIRYIYIPLGGTRNVLVSSVLIFTFVALWHDLSFKLLAWGWLVSLFLVPELIARTVLPQSKVSYPHPVWVHPLTLPPLSSALSGGIDMYAPLGGCLTSS